ncbi:SAUR-like auxin-responsive protein family [Forsythia ovata]|uniref:SAUR-like auxin-responsive protein family n=1 Tax=Forsythia ovata TaxID=205694 RepID=A0ABD1T9B4_9LAMI
MKRGLLILNLVRRTLRKLLTCIDYDFGEDKVSLLYNLPVDVKEGHFVVHTIDDGESRRFVVKLSYLAHPGFLKLLQQAGEEFGFRQKGILAVPCGYGDLQRLLESKKENTGW